MHILSKHINIHFEHTQKNTYLVHIVLLVSKFFNISYYILYILKIKFHSNTIKIYQKFYIPIDIRHSVKYFNFSTTRDESSSTKHRSESKNIYLFYSTQYYYNFWPSRMNDYYNFNFSKCLKDRLHRRTIDVQLITVLFRSHFSYAAFWPYLHRVNIKNTSIEFIWFFFEQSTTHVKNF